MKKIKIRTVFLFSFLFFRPLARGGMRRRESTPMLVADGLKPFGGGSDKDIASGNRVDVHHGTVLDVIIAFALFYITVSLCRPR